MADASTSEQNAVRMEIEDFFYHEADLLDDGKLLEWLELLTEDVEYEMPVRFTRERGSKEREFSEETHFFADDRETLEMKVNRLENDSAWSENPPSRTRRIVGNVQVDEFDDESADVRSNFHLYRARRDSIEHTVLSGERHDTIRWVDGEPRLTKREVFLDHTVLGTPNLSLFL